MKRFVTIALILSTVLVLVPTSAAQAANVKTKGLAISPLRQYLNIDAGIPKSSSFTVANLTDNPITVNLSVQQFSVSDYAYDYRFSDPPNNWLSLGLEQVRLQPHVSQRVPYTLNVPKGSAPGGQYYTLFASAQLSNGGIAGTVRAATLLYITINGKLVQTSQLKASSISHFSLGKQIGFNLNIANTGNIHYFVYVSGQLESPLVSSDYTPTTHLLFPGTVRTVTGSIPTPVFPGVYRATYGYKTDSGATVMRSTYVVYIPPWSVVAVIALAVGGVKLYRRQKRKKPTQS